MPKPYKTESEAVGDLARIIGPRFEEYRKQWDAVNRFEYESPFPLFLHIEPSFKCNLRCPMCTQGIPELKAKFGYDEQLNTEQVRDLLNQGRTYGCPSVSFQGDNEPFLIKEIPKWFSMARELGYVDVMVNTNGTVMTPKIAEEVIQSGLTRIRFSLDAIRKETYQKIRLGAKYEKVMQNIDDFLRIRKALGSSLPKVGVNFVRMSLNENEIDAFVEHWDPKVDYIVIQEFMAPDTEGDFRGMQGETKKPVEAFRCNQPWQRLYIRGNGDVTPCCAMFSSYLKLGKLEKTSLKEMWDSKAMKDLRQLHKRGRFAENPVCLKCSKNGFA